MDPERWERIKELFEAALERPEAARLEFLSGACSGDEPLRREVELLLSGHHHAGDFMQAPAIQQHAAVLVRDLPPSTFAVGEVISGRFKVLRFIGQGGMGEVYEARDLDLGARVALKTIRPEISSDQGALRRFKQEIQLARRVTHPNVCRMYDLERHQKDATSEISFLTMEMLEGETLAQRLRRQGKLTRQEALPLIREMADGLDAAHKAGIIHRDFKPGNVMLVDEGNAQIRKCRAVITDFGLACTSISPEASTVDSAGTASIAAGKGEIVGTFAYMAPEQIQGGTITAATDIYALGLVIYEMLTGHLPSQQTMSCSEVREKHSLESSQAREGNAIIDPHWNSVIAKCLDQVPRNRPSSGAQICALLEGRKTLSRRMFIGATVLGSTALATTLWLARRPTPHKPEAIVSLKRAQEFANRRTKEELGKAIEEYNHALKLEPDYADAWAGLADAYSAMANFNFMQPQKALEQAEHAALSAIRIDPKLAKAQGVLGYVKSLNVREWLTAEPYFHRALTEDPHEPDVHLWYGAFLGKLGRADEAIAQVRAGLEETPSSLALNQQLAVEYFRARRFPEFLLQAREVVRLQPFEASSYLALARALEWQGQFEEALANCDEAVKYQNAEAALCFRGSILAGRGDLKQARAIAAEVESYWRRQPFESVLLASLYARLGDGSKAVDVLNEGYNRNDSTILTAPTSPYFDSMQGDPSFRAFRRRLGLAG
jgi:serine/threonine protein kinase